MYSVLVTDDEPTAVKHIESIIEKKCPDFYVAGRARNGKEALEKTLDIHPDILITDIRMPVMDGIQLSEALYSSGEDTKIIIVSGYSEFGYEMCIRDRFKDDDGQVYYFWGQGSLRGGKLSEDLSEVIPETMVKGILTEDRDGFHEGISIRKRNGIYYLVYADSSRGRPTCLGYAMSDKPLGPYTKKGIIIDNTGCDPASWNNHGSVSYTHLWKGDRNQLLDIYYWFADRTCKASASKYTAFHDGYLCTDRI